MDEKEFCNLLNEFISILGDDPDASYFEFLMTFILWVFIKESRLCGFRNGTWRVT